LTFHTHPTVVSSNCQKNTHEQIHGSTSFRNRSTKTTSSTNVEKEVTIVLIKLGKLASNCAPCHRLFRSCSTISAHNEQAVGKHRSSTAIVESLRAAESQKSTERDTRLQFLVSLRSWVRNSRAAHQSCAALIAREWPNVALDVLRVACSKNEHLIGTRIIGSNRAWQKSEWV
jgi:hypothetical protein